MIPSRIDIGVLAVIFKNIGMFDIENLRNRLIMQKTIYLLQAFGLDIGYKFYWDKYGVYSEVLKKDSKEINIFYKELPTINLQLKTEAREKFDRYIKFMKNKKHNADKLEVASSIHYLYSLGWNKEKIEYIVNNKRNRFQNGKLCKTMWQELEEFKIIGEGSLHE